MKKNDKKTNNLLFAKNLNGKIIFIRHGETNYNIDYNKKGFKIKGDMDYLDGHLNSMGEQQALNASKIISSLNVEDVYVSPLFRALQTSTLIFKNHPNKDNITIHVHPLLTEIVSSMNNFLGDIDYTKKIFNMDSEIKVDWQIFDDEFKTKEEQNFYYINYIDLLPANKMELIKKNLNESWGNKKGKEILVELGKNIIEFKMQRLESLNHMFQRSVSFKKFLNEKYKESMGDSNKKIFIISHSCFGQIFTSKECYNLKNINKYPKDCCETDNCEAISVFI